jgi:hypothetical protein
MNIQKTNRLGLAIVKNGFIGGTNTMQKIQEIHRPNPGEKGDITLNGNLLTHNPRAKIIRVSKGIMEACKLIDIESIKKNIDNSNFQFKSMFILLDNDDSGVIKVERYGSDFSFMMISNLNLYGDHVKAYYNSYSFVSKSFSLDKDYVLKDVGIFDYEKSVFVVQLLTYLIFGDITEKHLCPNSRVNVGSTRFLNNSKLNITFCDSLWKQRINVDGFKVRGHFRLQPIGEGRQKRKLIWIEEFEKYGYNRRATVEMQQ